jgi:geranylgeranyl diphosphate synthase, type II
LTGVRFIKDSNAINSLYERERKKIEKKLQESVKNRKPVSLYVPASYILESGGKRLRPLLVLLSAKAVNGNFKDAYNAAVAVELLHNFTLVHDDIMDNADKRRNRLTLHKKFDTSTAILVGDGLLSVAYEYLLKDCNGNSKSVLSAFTRGLLEVCNGQSIDKDFESVSDVSLSDYIEMIKKKTASLLETCCRIGALLGGGSRKHVKALSNYGNNLGVAFQIQDDLLDIIGDEKELGKKVGGDLIEGKKTYLFVKAIEKAKGKEKNCLLKLVKNKGISKELIPAFKEIYIKLGVLEEAKNDIKKFSAQALNSIKIFRDEDRQIFRWLTDFLISRNR